MSPGRWISKRREPNPRNRLFTAGSHAVLLRLHRDKETRRGKGVKIICRWFVDVRRDVEWVYAKREGGWGGYKRSNCKIAAPLCGDRTVRTVSKLFDVYDAGWFTIYLCHELVFVIIIIPATQRHGKGREEGRWWSCLSYEQTTAIPRAL